jgi:capsular polysaccharide biosynthesis protein
MRAEEEPLTRPSRPFPEIEAEQEVEFGVYAGRIRARWWLVVFGVALGVVVGYLVSLGGGTAYRSVATIYLGQPLSPGGSQIQSVGTNPSTVAQIAKSREVVREVAAEVGIQPGNLRAGISTSAVSGSLARLGQSPLVDVSVRGPWQAESAEAANLLAQTVVDRVSGYVDAKVVGLENTLESQNRELTSLDRQIEANQAAVEDPELPTTERLVVLNLITSQELRRGQLLANRVQTRQFLSLAEEVERGRIVSEATPEKVAARGARNSMLVGGFIGLIAAAALALAWDRVLPRRLRAAG